MLAAGLAALFRQKLAVMTGPGNVQKIRHGAARKSAERDAGHGRGRKRYGHQARESKAIILWAGRGMILHRSCSFGRVGGRHPLITPTAFRIANALCGPEGGDDST